MGRFTTSLATLALLMPALASADDLSFGYYHGSIAGPIMSLEAKLSTDGRLVREERDVEYESWLDSRERKLAQRLLNPDLIDALQTELEGYGSLIEDGGVFVEFEISRRFAYYAPGECEDPLPTQTSALRAFLNQIIRRHFGKSYLLPSCEESNFE